MRWSTTFLLAGLLTLVAACGSSGDDGDGGNGSEPSQAAEPTPDSGGGGDGDGDGDGGSGNLDELMDSLTPPNSSESSRTSGADFLYVIFESSDSTDSLRGFYESAIPDAGMEEVTTMQSEGSYSWIFTRSGDDAFGGLVGVIPATDGGAGSIVTVQLGSGS